MIYSGLFFLISVALCSAYVKLPPYLKTCSRNDPRLNECAFKNGKSIIPKIISGDPRIRLPRLDPLVLNRIEISSASSGTLTMRLRCYKCHVYGLSQAQLLDININLKKRHVDIRLRIPKLMVIGNYDVSGKILIFPLSGRGVSNITLVNLDVTARLDWYLFRRNKIEYGQFDKHNVSFTSSYLRINLSNLLNDPQISKQLNVILNENWKDVLNDLKPSISDTVGQIIKIIMNQIFDLIPYSQFFPE